MILDNNLICYEYFNNLYTLKPVTPSGAKDGDVEEDKYAFNKNSMALLLIEEDIVNADGFGLKKGFYNVTTDKYMDFLIIIQSGKIKAKVPVIQTKMIENVNPVQFKPKKMSYKKFQTEQQKNYRKYLNGTNPEEIDIKTAQIQRLNEENSYIIIYNAANVELTGIIKF